MQKISVVIFRDTIHARFIKSPFSETSFIQSQSSIHENKVAGRLADAGFP